MRILLPVLVFSCALQAQYYGFPLDGSKPHDSTNNMVVTFHGKLTEVSKKDFTIETEDQPAFVIERSRKTRFLKNGKAVKPEDVPVGTALAVDVVKDPDLHPMALAVIVEPKPVQK